MGGFGDAWRAAPDPLREAAMATLGWGVLALVVIPAIVAGASEFPVLVPWGIPGTMILTVYATLFAFTFQRFPWPRRALSALKLTACLFHGVILLGAGFITFAVLFVGGGLLPEAAFSAVVAGMGLLANLFIVRRLQTPEVRAFVDPALVAAAPPAPPVTHEIGTATGAPAPAPVPPAAPAEPARAVPHACPVCGTPAPGRPASCTGCRRVYGAPDGVAAGAVR